MDELLRCENLRVSLGGREILRSIDLCLNAGTLTGVIGPNGSGKSTLLKALVGDVEYAGSVLIRGLNLPELGAKERAQNRAVMPQTNSFPFAYLVDDVVRMGRFCWAGTPEQDEQIVADALEKTDTAHLRYRFITDLSGGESARVTLARVLAQQTPLVFLDEPTAAFDISHQERTMSLCRDLAASGAAVMVIVHDLDLAAAYCDQLVLLQAGKVVARGTASDVMTSERLLAVYEWPIDVRAEGSQLRISPVRQR